MKLIDALAWKYPGTSMSISGEKIVQWDSKFPQPDEVEIETIKQQYLAYKASILYQSKRAAEYPPAADQLDAIWKIIASIKDLGSAPADALAVKNLVQAVKDKYPKSVSVNGGTP